MSVALHSPVMWSAPIWIVVTDAVVAETGVARDDMFSRSMLRPRAEARQLAMFVLRRITDLSNPEVGRRLGGLDHTTVMHAERKIADRVARDWDWASRAARVMARVAAHYAAPTAPALPLILAQPPRPPEPEPLPEPEPETIAAPSMPAPERPRVIPPPLTRHGARVIVHHRRPAAASYDFGDPPADLAARRAAAGFATSGSFKTRTSEMQRMGW